MATPKLRFKEFNGDWKNLSYKDVLTINYGKDHKKLSEGNIPVYGTGGVMRHVDQYLYAGESILIGRKGTIDKPKYVNEEFWTVDTLFYTKIKSNALPKFIFQHSMQVNWLGLNEATGVPSLNTNSINNVAIGLPTLHEQTKIANFLSAVDEKINQLSQKIELLTQYKQGMMQNLFSQKIRFKADDGSEFGEWKEIKLGDIGENIIGLTYSPSDLANDENSILVLRSSNIKNGRLDKSDQVRVVKKIKDKIIIKPDDILICARNGSQRLIGKSVLINDNEKMTFGAFMSVYRSKYNRFIAYLMQTPWYFEQVQMNLGARINQITTGTLNEFKFNIPSIEEQTKIANFLSSIDQKIDLTEQQLQQAKQWKKGLLQQMFV